MAVNMDKPERWKADVALSVDTYNKWFMRFAPKTYKKARIKSTKEVKSALAITSNLRNITPSVLSEHPSILPILRMATAPPIARDRLVGLSRVPPHLVTAMEKDSKMPEKMSKTDESLRRIGELIRRLADTDIFPWLDSSKAPASSEVFRASTIVADRLCGASSDPIIRNSQEQRQLRIVGGWLRKRGYRKINAGKGLKHDEMEPGTFANRLNVPVKLNEKTRINIPIDVVVRPLQSRNGELPIFIEAKSAGDFTNTNKRRKEEATKVSQLRENYGEEVRFILFLCGYFDTGYLGYEAAEGIDWVWEHRVDDLGELEL